MDGRAYWHKGKQKFERGHRGATEFFRNTEITTNLHKDILVKDSLCLAHPRVPAVPNPTAEGMCRYMSILYPNTTWINFLSAGIQRVSEI